MIRVLIVDDSATVRGLLKRQLSRDPEIQVVGAAPDPYAARDMILKLRPDVLTLDIEMPRMNGLTFLKKLMAHYPLPVIILSSVAEKGSHNAIEALRLGAVDVISKAGAAESIGEIGEQLARKIKAAATVHVDRLKPVATAAAPAPTPTAFTFAPGRVIAIGASTGGTRAIEAVVRSFPPNAPGTLLVQHMPVHFTKSFADGLNRVCAIQVREAKHGDMLTPGLALVAPGNHHMVLKRAGTSYRVETNQEPREHYQRPAVDVTFRSVAAAVGPEAVGVVLTGMGADGATGLLQMRQAGAHTIAQDRETSVVYGMPKEAAALNAAEKVLPLSEIARATLLFATAARGAA